MAFTKVIVNLLVCLIFIIGCQQTSKVDSKDTGGCATNSIRKGFSKLNSANVFIIKDTICMHGSEQSMREYGIDKEKVKFKYVGYDIVDNEGLSMGFGVFEFSSQEDAIDYMTFINEAGVMKAPHLKIMEGNKIYKLGTQAQMNADRLYEYEDIFYKAFK